MRFTVRCERHTCRIRDELTGKIDPHTYREDFDNAYRTAAELNAKYDDTGGLRDPNTVERYDPPRPVEIQTDAGSWSLGIQDMWIRTDEGWIAHTRLPHMRHWRWLPAKRLRPPTPPTDAPPPRP